MFEKLKSNNNMMFFYLFLAGIGVIAYNVIGSFISLIILSFIIVTIFQPLYKVLLRAFRGNRMAATGVSTLSVVLTIVVPIIIIINLTIFQFIVFYNDFKDFFDIPDTQEETTEVMGENTNNTDENTEFVYKNESKDGSYTIDTAIADVNKIIDYVPYVEYELTIDKVRNFAIDNLDPALRLVLDLAKNSSTLVLQLPSNFIIFIYLLAAMFPNQQNIINYIKKLSPFDDKVDDMYITRFIEMSHAMVKGSLLVAIIQGVVSGLLLWFIGVDYVIFLSIIMIFLSMIPLGSGFINIPIGVVLILTGNYVKGILVLINHFVVITYIDDLVRPRLVPKKSELPPVLTLMSVIGGLKYFGFFGFIFGPVVMIFLVTTLQIYMKYYKSPGLHTEK